MWCSGLGVQLPRWIDCKKWKNEKLVFVFVKCKKVKEKNGEKITPSQKWKYLLALGRKQQENHLTQKLIAFRRVDIFSLIRFSSTERAKIGNNNKSIFIERSNIFNWPALVSPKRSEKLYLISYLIWHCLRVHHVEFRRWIVVDALCLHCSVLLINCHCHLSYIFFFLYFSIENFHFEIENCCYYMLFYFVLGLSSVLYNDKW